MTKPATHRREVRFCKPDFFVINDTLTSVDGNAHDYEVIFHLDTTKVNPVSGYKNAVISDFGKKYDIVMIPLDCECADAELKTVSAQTEPVMQGWYNGRNEANLHKAITVSREVKGVKNYRFTTLMFPITKDKQLPKVEKTDNGRIYIEFNGNSYTLDIDALNK